MPDYRRELLGGGLSGFVAGVPIRGFFDAFAGRAEILTSAARSVASGQHWRRRDEYGEGQQ
jgi:hypothetical protein